MAYEIDKQTSNIINITKIVAIILVCYIHSYRDSVNFVGNTIQLDIPLWFEIIQYSISKILGTVAVPLFFFFSALLLYRKSTSWGDNFKKKIKTLLIPYLILNTVGILSFFVLQQIPALSSFFSKPENIVAEWNFADWVNAYTGYRRGCPMLFTLWFVRNLFILNLFFIPIKFLVQKFNLKFILFLCIAYIFIYQLYTDTILHGFATSIFYWSLGCYFCVNNIKLETIKDFSEKYHLLPIYFIFCPVFFMLHCANFLYLDALRPIAIIIGLFCFIACIYKIKNIRTKDILLKLAPYTFPIYLFHEFNLTFFRKLLSAILPNTIVFIVSEYILCPLIIIAYCILLSVLLNKLSPKAYSIVTGGRTAEHNSK